MTIRQAHAPHRSITIALSALLGLTLLATGCAPEPAEETDDEPLHESLFFTTLVRGTDSALRDTLQVVLRSPQEWDSFRRDLYVFEPPRSVDFDQAMLVAVALPVDTGGYMLDVESVEYSPDSVYISYTVYEPGGDCLNVEAAVTPFHVVEVRRVDEPVKFSGRREYVFCDRRR